MRGEHMVRPRPNLEAPPITHVTIYTDGACLGNPGPGGYAAVLMSGERRKEISGGFSLTTNNRMELLAAVRALETLTRPCDVTLHSDSRYLVDGIAKGWATRWKARGWRKADGTPALNPDLWDRLLSLCTVNRVRFVWVQGHAGNEENECCDRMSVAAAGVPGQPPDPGYVGGPSRGR